MFPITMHGMQAGMKALVLDLLLWMDRMRVSHTHHVSGIMGSFHASSHLLSQPDGSGG